MSPTSNSRVTLADVEAAVRATELPARRKQELLSSLKTAARALGLDPASINADPQELARELNRVGLLGRGVSGRRWNNVRSHVRAALGLVQPMVPSRATSPITPEWLALYQTISSRSDQLRLSRLLRWLSVEGIAPGQVTWADVDRHHALLKQGTLIRDLDQKRQHALRAWDRAALSVPGWPDIRPPKHSKSPSFSFGWSVFPLSLKDEVDRWLDRLAGTDPFDEEGPVRPLSAVTIRARENDMRAFASALVLRGKAAGELVSIDKCLTIENYKEGLRFFVDRLGKDAPRLAQVANSMRSVAKHWVKVDSATLKQMTDITRRMPARRLGMTPKNRVRLIAASDPGICKAFVSLPAKLKKEVASGKHGLNRNRVLSQMAAAIAIELTALLRVKNLAGLEIGRHLVTVGPKLLISIPSNELKNKANDLVIELPEAEAEIVWWYVSEYRSSVFGNSFLFPGRNGGPKAIRTLQAQIQKTVRDYTGLEWHVHLFRHFGAKRFLEQRPGEYEVVRRVLGHSSMQTTTNAYSGLETVSAGRYFSSVVMRLQNADEESG